MLKLNCRLILLLLLLTLLGACGDSTETESQKVVEPTKAQPGAVAQPHAALVRDAAAKLLDSYQQVLAGYKAMYGHYPASVKELDQSDYFFDTDYLADLAGKDFQVYLWLAADGSTFKVWCLQTGKAQGYLVDHQSVNPLPLSRAELLSQVEGGYQAQLQKAGLSLLTPKG